MAAKGSKEEVGAVEALINPSGVAVTFSGSRNRNNASTPLSLSPRRQHRNEVSTSLMLEEREEGEKREGLFETLAEKRVRRISHVIASVNTFIMSVGFTIIIPGVWPYLQQLIPACPQLEPGVSKQYLGWVVAANPLGQMFASPLLGLWTTHTGYNRGALLLTMLMFILGSGLYAVLSVFGSAAKGVMIFSRFLVGVGSGNIAIIRSYIAASTRLQERTTTVAMIAAAQALGYIIGPAIQTALVVAFSEGASDPSRRVTVNELKTLEDEMRPIVEWNMYTATGWFSVVLGVVTLILFLPCFFKEHNIAAKEAELQLGTNKGGTLQFPKLDYIAMICILVTFFIDQMMLIVLETLAVPLCMDLYAWSDERAIMVVAIGMSVIGILSIGMFKVSSLLSNWIDERKVLIVLGILPLTLSMLLCFPMGSTYPKIKNCTNLVPLNTTTEPGVMSLPVKLTNGEMERHLPKLEGLSIEDVRALRMLWDNAVTEGVTTLFHVDVQNGIVNLSATTTQRRRRRDAVRDDTCDDLGCPPNQEWCLYTPIIEKPQLIVATLFAFSGFSVAFMLCNSIFSKILGPNPQGFWMGILTSTGSLSRFTSPILATYLYTSLGTRFVFGTFFVMMTCTLIFVVVFYKRIKPMQIVRGS